MLDAITRQDVEDRFNRITARHGWTTGNQEMSMYPDGKAAADRQPLCSCYSDCPCEACATLSRNRGSGHARGLASCILQVCKELPSGPYGQPAANAPR